jgi:hypothetical protein
MEKNENLLREFLDALLSTTPALKGVAAERSIDDNVASTGVSERLVKACHSGLRAHTPPPTSLLSSGNRSRHSVTLRTGHRKNPTR